MICRYYGRLEIAAFLEAAALADRGSVVCMPRSGDRRVEFVVLLGRWR